ncbi:MAG TPA: GNAT family N-acetyltransferase [Candidatus Acidoferrales bacterium]|nr:GNAT family N-acetyltransferase [Candidatus Acidoferrales bacterium]
MNRWFPLETERLLLREFRAADEPDIHAYACDPEVVRLMIWGPNTPEMTRTYLEGVLEAQQRWPRPEVGLAVELTSERRVIGSIGLRIKDARNRTADIGYILNRTYWGQGYMVEAARAVLDAAFRAVGLHRVWATCDPRNRASYRVMEKLGMRREAHFRKDVMEKGEWRDSYLYAILSEEWRSSER